MNKTLLILISVIVVVAGLIGYTVFSKQDSGSQNTKTVVPHDDTGLAPHDDTDTTTQNPGVTAPHDDTGTAPHID